MSRAIVTVKREGEARVRDLEIPNDLPAAQVAELIAQTLHWDTNQAGQPITYAIMAEPPGRVLRGDEMLSEAGVWDGAWLVFQPASGRVSPLPPPPPPAAAEAHGPVGGWHAIPGITLPQAQPQPDGQPDQQQPETAGGRFAWKEIA